MKNRERNCEFCGRPVRKGRWCGQFCQDKWTETEPGLVDQTHPNRLVDWKRLGQRDDYNRGWMRRKHAE